MIKLALKIRCKQVKQQIRIMKRALAKRNFGRIMVLIGELIKALLVLPLNLPVRLFATIVLNIADDLGINITSNKMCDKYSDLIDELEALQEEARAN